MEICELLGVAGDSDSSMKNLEESKKTFPEIDHLQIALDEASIYLIENYDKKGIKYRKTIMDQKELVTCGCCNETETIEYWLKHDYDPNEWNCPEDFIEWIKSK